MNTFDILTQATRTELTNAVQENLFTLFRTMAQTLPGGELVETGPLALHHTFPTNPMFKGAWQTRASEETLDALIDQTIAWFQARNAPYFFWWTGPGTRPGNLGQRLQAHGLLDMAELSHELVTGIHQTEQGAPCMITHLAEVDETLLNKTPSGFVIREITEDTALADFKKVFIDTYEVPVWAGQAWVDATLSIGIEKSPWRIYVGYLDGDPVATNILFNGAGVAGVYGVATLPSVQRKGIGAAITLKPLLDARAMGYRYGVLFATEMGIPVYQRIGFELTAVRLNRYLWRNSL